MQCSVGWVYGMTPCGSSPLDWWFMSLSSQATQNQLWFNAKLTRSVWDTLKLKRRKDRVHDDRVAKASRKLWTDLTRTHFEKIKFESSPIGADIHDNRVWRQSLNSFYFETSAKCISDTLSSKKFCAIF